MDNLETRIAAAIGKKLEDGTVERLAEKWIEKAVSKSLKDIFSYGGKGRELIDEKLSEVIVPTIERNDFNRYLVKLDTVLTEIVNNTSLADNRRLLKNFKGIMKEPDIEEIKLSEIFRKYCGYVAKHVNPFKLNEHIEYGVRCFDCVTAHMDIEHEHDLWRTHDFDRCIVQFTCDEDESLECRMELYKQAAEINWCIMGYGRCIDVNSLRRLSEFEVYVQTLKRGFVDVIMDEESDVNDGIQPEEDPH